MKLTVLGKYGPFSPAGGGTSSYRVDSTKTSIALDFGSCALSRWKKFGEKLPDAVVLSHLHFDHMADLLPLAYATQERLKVFMPFTECAARDLILSVKEFDCVEIRDGMSIEFNDLKFRFNEMTHALQSFCVRVDDGKSVLFYSGDTKYNDEIARLMSGCDLALLDAAQPDDSPASVSHMRISDAEKLCAETKVKTLISHVYPGIAPRKSETVAEAEEMRTYEF